MNRALDIILLSSMVASMDLFTALNEAKNMILYKLLLLKGHIFAMIILKCSV